MGLHETRIGILNLGLNDGIKNTELFPLATRAQQGLAYIKYKGKESLFITVRCDVSNSPSQGQACRIVQFNFDRDGRLDCNPVAYSKILPVGHGQGFGAIVKNGELYFYCQSRYDQLKENRYRGVSQIHWRGNDTDAKDVKQIPLLPNSAFFSKFSFLTPSVSTDGKYLVALCKDKMSGHSCLVYQFNKLSNYVEPINIFPVSAKLGNDTGWQGICADEKYIYCLYGGIYALDPHIIVVYDYKGKKIKEYEIQDEKKYYGGTSGILKYSYGTPWNIELEGIAKRGNELYITGVCTIGFDGEVVSWNNKNYICLATTDGTQTPKEKKYWMLTEKPAKSGRFEPGRKYYSGKDILRTNQKYVSRYKYMYKLTLNPGD